MAIENFKEVEKYFEDNKDNKDVQGLVKKMQGDLIERANKELTKENVAQFIEKVDSVKQNRESYKDAAVTGGIETWQKNNLDKYYQDRHNKEHPPEDERDKRERQTASDMAGLKKELAIEKIEKIAMVRADELGFNKTAKVLLSNFISDTKEKTIQNVNTMNDVFEIIKKEAKEAVLEGTGTGPEEGDGRVDGDLLTVEQMSNLTPEAQAALPPGILEKSRAAIGA